jgi:predicted MFS family arabinose efflux permease
MPEPGQGHRIRHHAGQAFRATHRQLERRLGGRQRTQVILILACVLALSSADSATVGAAAAPLRTSLHIDNTDIGLLVTVSSLVAAAASIPFGVVADRWRRTWVLGTAIVAWGAAMLWSATAGTFGGLLLSRLVLGGVTAAAGPVLASLVGDYFEGSERGRIYSYILTGELAGAGIGFAITGDIAAISWRAAFVLLALPAFVLAWYVFHLPEPKRGGSTPLRPDGVVSGPQPGPRPAGRDSGPAEDGDSGPTDAQLLAAARGIGPEEGLVLVGPKLDSLGFFGAAKAVLRIRTNVILIIASACGYFYLSGVETFGTEFVRQQYRIDQVLANLLLLVVGVGAVVGTLVSGAMSDRLLRGGFLNARILVAAMAAIGATVLFIPALAVHSAATAVPYLIVAALLLSAQNPPIDAARLDIVPAQLWGRAEAVRTVLRSLAQSLAPVLFGFTSDEIFGGGRHGLQWTFSIMLVSMGASGVILLRALRTYPRDVATAGASRVVGNGIPGGDTAAGRGGAAPNVRPAGPGGVATPGTAPRSSTWPSQTGGAPAWPEPAPPAYPDKP